MYFNIDSAPSKQLFKELFVHQNIHMYCVRNSNRKALPSFPLQWRVPDRNPAKNGSSMVWALIETAPMKKNLSEPTWCGSIKCPSNTLRQLGNAAEIFHWNIMQRRYVLDVELSFTILRFISIKLGDSEA